MSKIVLVPTSVFTLTGFAEQLPQSLLPLLGLGIIGLGVLLPLLFTVPLLIRKDRRTLHELISKTRVSEQLTVHRS